MRVLGTAYERFCTNFPTCLIVLDKQPTEHPEYMAMAQVQVNNLINAVAHLN